MLKENRGFLFASLDPAMQREIKIRESLTLFNIQMIPTKTSDSPIYAMKRPMLISL